MENLSLRVEYGVYCRPSCPARRPRRENVQFFLAPDQAEKAGYRACLRCRPKSVSGNAESDEVKAICRFIEQHLDEPLTLDRLGKEFRQSSFHLQRRFKLCWALRRENTPILAACAC